MTHKKLFTATGVISGFILLLMAILRNTESEIVTFLSILLGLVIFYSLLYYLFQTERIRMDAVNPHLKYLFWGVSIPLLIFGVEATEDIGEGFFSESIKIILAIEISYIIFYLSFRYWRNIQKLKSDKLEAELMLLKNQINPHFFFNTLNNLYSLIKKDAEAAQDYVMKLSDLMRYTIYDSGKESVLLKDEISYLLNFIDLQTARYHKDIDVNFEKTVKNLEAKVAPLLFIILLENAFKHGVEKVTKDAFVHINLIEDDYKICFTVINNFDSDQTLENVGIGLKNLKNRLNLLYPNSHQLSYNNDEKIYSATVEIRKK